jgi:AAA family ATP:ADP antiporter
MSLLQRALGRIVDVRREETATMLLMFAYSFLAMAGYNIVKPATRSQFIDKLGADNLPYVQLVAGLIMGFVIQGYTSAMRLLPRRWVFAATQAVMVGLLILFWVFFQSGQSWVSVVFYLWGVLAGSLLISQFWSLANVIFDARQAKRLFGFVGGGASLGGIAGSGFAGNYAKTVGTNNLLLVAAATLGVCFVVVWLIAAREKTAAEQGEISGDDDKGMSPLEAIRLLRSSKHFQVIALVISFAAIGAGIIEQQLNMAVAEAIPGKDERTALLANVIFYSSIAGFLIQMTLTSRLHRLLGIGFAMLLMPVTTGASAALMLVIPALWTSTLARVLDTSLRYTVDKTTREILFVPLPTNLKYKAKPFADVAVDRFAKGVGAAVALIIAIKIFHFTWWQLSYLSLGVALLWIWMALRARGEYLRTFRQSLVTRDVQASELRLNVADLTTIETLVQELAHPDPARVIYAIDVLESLDKRNLVTPLLLYHESPKVRRRALAALGDVRSDIAQQWIPHIRRMLGDGDAGVRAAAIGALSSISQEDAATFARPLLADPDPRIRATAAVAMTASARPEDVDQAESTLLDLTSDSSDSARAARRDVAVAIRQIADPRFRRLLIPLLYDSAPEVADEAMESVQTAKVQGVDDFIFVPSLVSLLRNRQLKGRARAALVGYGEPVVDSLAFFLRDPEEDIWVRRHIPGTLAQIPSQKTMDVLAAALDERDGFIRFKVVSALERLRREHPELKLAGERIETLVVQEARRYFNFLSLHDNLFGKEKLSPDSLLSQALIEQMARLRNRIFKLLSLLYPPADIDAARWTLEHGDGRGRSSASEYLDNLLSTPLRRQVLPVIEDMRREERVRRGNVLIKTRPRDVEETLLQLINDDDPVTAAAAIDVVREQKMWNLADDVEHVLAHRDVKDWYVFEAASWTLAERRMPAERRRELWLEPLPAAELAGRLRRLPLFASVSVDELFRMASASRQVRHETGSVLAQEGSVPSSIHILLDGRVTVAGRDAAPSFVDAPSALGFVEAMAGLAMPETNRTSGSAVTLALTVDELRTLLADNTDLVSGLFATLAERSEESDHPVHPTQARSELEQLASGGLTAIDRVFALQYVPLFRRVSADEMQHLATVAAPVKMAAGSVLFPESAPPALWLLLTGEVVLESSTGQPAVTARGGNIIGSIDTMAGRSLGRSAKVITGGVALRIDREDLFDLLAERPDLLRQMFAGMFKRERPLVAAAAAGS